MNSFKSAAPTTRVANVGHVLERLILLRLSNILDLPPFEPDWCCVDDAFPWMRGSLDGLLPDLIADAKAVLLGSADQWRKQGTADPLDGLPGHIRYQMLWYCGITGLPVVVAALLIPEYNLRIDPVLASQLYELRIYHLDPVTHAAEIADLRATVTALRATGQVARTSPAAPQGPQAGAILSLGLDAGRALARLAEATAARGRADLNERSARDAVHALIPPFARGITAGGRTCTRDLRGVLHLR